MTSINMADRANAAPAAPGYTMSEFTPSTVPGCRTPHLWLGNGRSLYDGLGPEYTLLRLDPAIGAGPLQQTAAAQGVPLSVLDLVSEEASALYDRKLVLSRPDQHIPWRGDALPADLGFRQIDPLCVVSRRSGPRPYRA